MKYYVIAGEASGDLHGANLLKHLYALDVQAEIRCWGGDKMQTTGAILVKHFRDLAFMGFTEVVKNLPTILRNMAFCKQDIIQFAPDVLVLVDYPGFNLRIANWAKTQGIRVVYYIAPQVWAWKPNRVKAMKQSIYELLTILPFETNYFKNQWNWAVTYVGHPLVQVVKEAKQTTPASLSTKPIIAVLPGSRKQEISKKLPIMLAVAKHFTNYQFIVAKAPGLDDSFYEPFMLGYSNVTTVSNQTYTLLMQSSAALVTSGTATLETALFKVPQIVCYKTSSISYEIGKRLIKIPYISLVNLIMNQLVVKELIQHALTEENITTELSQLLNNQAYRQEVLQKYDALEQNLLQDVDASLLAAQRVVNAAQTLNS
jgi:lipid-A-disaccharide synthase